MVNVTQRQRQKRNAILRETGCWRSAKATQAQGGAFVGSEIGRGK